MNQEQSVGAAFESTARMNAVKLFISAVSAAPGVFSACTPETFADEIISGTEKLLGYLKNGSH